MGNYTDQTLAPGERVLYRAKLHWAAWLSPAVAFAIVVWIAARMQEGGGALFAFFFIFLIVPMLIRSLFLWLSTEATVTTQRVVMRQGFIRRRALELQLTHAGSMQLDQSIVGRLLNYGSVSVSGASTKDGFSYLENPVVFRKNVHEAVQTRMGTGPAVVPVMQQAAT